MKPERGIDGPDWIYPGDTVFKKERITGLPPLKFICSTFDNNSLEYGKRGKDGFAYFRIHPERFPPNTKAYERARVTGFTRDEVVLPEEQLLLL